MLRATPERIVIEAYHGARAGLGGGRQGDAWQAGDDALLHAPDRDSLRSRRSGMAVTPRRGDVLAGRARPDTGIVRSARRAPRRRLTDELNRHLRTLGRRPDDDRRSGLSLARALPFSAEKMGFITLDQLRTIDRERVGAQARAAHPRSDGDDAYAFAGVLCGVAPRGTAAERKALYL